MMAREHRYDVTVEWEGNCGAGTESYRAYGREHVIGAAGKPPIPGSSDPAFRGNPDRWNPEELLVAAVAACHKLWYLHLACEAGISVLAYRDEAIGLMVEDAQAGDRMTEIVLRPHVTIRAGDDPDLALRVHHDVPARCAIANSVKCAIRHEPVIDVGA
jgi:organic hydroperoxide reductase OsmC/OhrA